jgi:hypothetical protein
MERKEQSICHGSRGLDLAQRFLGSLMLLGFSPKIERICVSFNKLEFVIIILFYRMTLWPLPII